MVHGEATITDADSSCQPASRRAAHSVTGSGGPFTGKRRCRHRPFATESGSQAPLATIYEESLGAIAKGGSTPLNAVYRYTETVTERGLVVMDTPGYDPVSATGQVAGSGANIIVFTAGRGSCFGYKPAPSIKVATNSPTYEKMQNDMDINASVVLEGIRKILSSCPGVGWLNKPLPGSPNAVAWVRIMKP